MNTPIGVYEVTGNRRYRGHDPGTIFEARIQPGPEFRAVARGDIRLIDRFVPFLRPGSYRLPPGWTAGPPQEGGGT